MLSVEYVKHNTHFSQWFQILNLSEVFDNSPLFETFLGVHNMNSSVFFLFFGSFSSQLP